MDLILGVLIVIGSSTTFALLVIAALLLDTVRQINKEKKK